MIAPIPFFEDRGAPIRVYEEAKSLTILGNVVDIICYHLGRDVPEINKIHRIINIPWYKKTTAGPSYHKIYLDILLFFKVLNVLKSKNFDILHAHLHEGSAIAQFINILHKTKKPMLFDAQGSLTGEMMSHGYLKKNSSSLKLWEYIEKKIYNGSGYIIASSPYLVEIIKEKFQIPPDKIKLIFDGVDTELFNPNKYKKEKILTKYGLMNRQIVLYTGLFNKYQGTNFLIEKVIPKVVKENPKAIFILIGYPKEEYVKLAKNIGVYNNILFTGKIKYHDIPPFLAAADVAVSPKFIKSGEANLKMFTYMAMGLPTVSFDYKYNKLILQSTGLITKPGDSTEYAEAILKLLDNNKKRKRMGKKARFIAEKKYSWLSVAQNIKEIYDQLC